jgi:hypothetical protein
MMGADNTGERRKAPMDRRVTSVTTTIIVVIVIIIVITITAIMVAIALATSLVDLIDDDLL